MKTQETWYKNKIKWPVKNKSYLHSKIEQQEKNLYSWLEDQRKKQEKV